jgi:Phosphodiester glycosidase
MKRRRLLIAFLAVLLVSAVCVYAWNLRRPTPPTVIFQGVTYGCVRLESNEQGNGLVHWVRVDLTAPGIELFVTPLDPEAVKLGWQYRLQRTETVLDQQALSVAINGVYFTADSGWMPKSGDLARSSEATIAQYIVSHVPESTYMLGFDEQLVPRIEEAWPRNETTQRRYRWGLGGQGGLLLRHGQIFQGTSQKPTDARTAVGIDREKRLLFLAVFENASERRALEKLSQLGAVDGMLLDGGHSSSMVLRADARGVRPGVLLGHWRPVATHFGVRASSLPAE